MISIKYFTFNPFGENTYVLWDETKECIIIDAGMYFEEERNALLDFIKKNNLEPVRLLNTHCHIDHVLGNAFIHREYGLKTWMHQADLPVLDALMDVAQKYMIPNVEQSPEPQGFLEEGEEVIFGNSILQIVFTPGHSPGSISFYNTEQKLIIAGDVLFDGSIGRSDLPGGDHDTLIKSIKTKLFPLGDDYKVYAGHGEPTTIQKEKNSNPFLI